MLWHMFKRCHSCSYSTVAMCHNFKKMMRIMAYVERIIGTFGGIIGRNAKNCRIE